MAGPSIYIVNPRCDAPSYYTADVFSAHGLAPAVLVADLAIVTLAAMVPSDFTVSICDETVTPVDLAASPDFVAITGKVSQWARMQELAAHFRSLGRRVIIGGPHASLSPDVVRPHCDILVRGEIEEIAPSFFADLRRGEWEREYVGNRPSLDLSPVPRWDLYPNGHALLGAAQTSRGCPFECEFCDVIEYLGRHQRHKDPEQVCTELDVLYRHGYRNVFLADDNLTVHRARARTLLEAIRIWNLQQTDGQMSFVTQVSIEASTDDELLKLCVAAGLGQVFIGIETPNEDSLRLSKKRQNLKRDLGQAARRFVQHGISVDGGMIVGFDGDDLNIFERQYEFAMSTPIPIFSLGALVAPAATPLHRRLAAEGRLVNSSSEVAASPWDTNIIPDRMSRAELMEGIQWLCNALYAPEAFASRLFDFMETFGELNPECAAAPRSTAVNGVYLDAFDVATRLADLGPKEAAMVTEAMAKMQRRPELRMATITHLMRYAQVRHMYSAGGFWAPAHRPAFQLLAAL
jgi:radical SAM superfamily enzyme YgiQ (UPF0313 family)